ncbi:MAG: TatD family hydrolase [Bacteroidaceae bacterium]|nr:TatD family hydrolase [Bacteroidaceae bacterium]
MKRIIDTHTHIYVEDFNQDLADVIERARSVGLYKLFLPNINTESVEQMMAVCNEYQEMCYPMIGLHPTDLEENYKFQLSSLKKILDDDRAAAKRFVAIGEIGIDLYWDDTKLKEQIDAFEAQLEWALEFDLPVSIHSRSAFNALCGVMDKYKNTPLRGIFHCFSGNAEEAAKLLEYSGFMLGIGGTVTYKKSPLPEVLQRVPLNRIVLETDAPYLPPVPYRGKRNEPSYLLKVIECLAGIYSSTPDEIAETTTNNAELIFVWKNTAL